MGNAHTRVNADRSGEFAPRDGGIVNTMEKTEQAQLGMPTNVDVTTAQFEFGGEKSLEQSPDELINESLDQYVSDISALIREEGIIVSDENNFSTEDADEIFEMSVDNSDRNPLESMSNISSSSPDRIGGLPNFSPESEEYQRTNLDSLGYDGTRNGNMYVYTDSNEEPVAYVYHMDSPKEQSHIAHRELVGSTTFETLGLDVPRHEYHTTENWVASESWGTDIEPRITHEQGFDVVTAAIISGNFDIKAENMRQKTTGQYSIIDHDRAGGKMWKQDSSYSWGDYKQAIQRATFTLRKHTNDMSIDTQDVHENVQKRTKEIVKRGGHKTLAKNLGAYNETMAKNAIGNIATVLLVDDVDNFSSENSIQDIY